MSIGSDEVQAAVHTMVTAHAPCHPGLLVQIIFKLRIYVVENGLPAGEEGGRGKIACHCSTVLNWLERRNLKPFKHFESSTHHDSGMQV